jgi:phosphopantothenoylcysteine decarboxylase/phosphopantothenate--cysteine ligase
MPKAQATPSAAITVRGLQESLRRELRKRAAGNDRSMEEEVRSILAAAVASPSGAARVVESPAQIREPASRLAGASVLLVIAGGIAAYKSLDLIRRFRERGTTVRVVMTRAAEEFVTPLSASALSGGRVFTDLFDRDSEFDVGHIRLAREADIVVVAPATADLIARMAAGRADDIAAAILLATEAPVLLAPAMNPAMWAHPATKRNVAALVADGIRFIGPNAGAMAEAGEAGIGRMAEPLEILAAAQALVESGERPLSERHVVVTSGPTHEPIDPVRYLANRSSGRQGHAIAAAAARAGARVTLVCGPVTLPDPSGVTVVHVETAREMLDAVLAALPADVVVMAAAVADWRVADARNSKMKKGATAPALALTENPDILATVGKLKRERPALVVGFAAETDDLIANAAAKLDRKGADWIVANDVSPQTGVMGGEENAVHILSAASGKVAVEDWPKMNKSEVAARLVGRIAVFLSGRKA